MMGRSNRKKVKVQIEAPLDDLENLELGNGKKKFHKRGGRAKKNSGSTAAATGDDNDSAAGQGGGGSGSGDSSIASSFMRMRQASATLLVFLIMVLGLATSAAFVSIGISGALQEHTDDFRRSSMDTVAKIQDAFEDYVTACSLVHARCRHRDFTRRDFRELYEYIIATGLQFKAVQFDPNITHSEREAAEDEARLFYEENYPEVNYQGIRGFNTLDSTTLEPRIDQDFYFPIHYMEPIPGNEAAIDLDYHSSAPRIRAVKSLFDKMAPSMTDRLSLVKQKGQVSRCGDHDGPSYGVVLMHPGVKLDDPRDVWPRDFSSMVICVPDLIKRSTTAQSKTSKVYIHDLSTPDEESVFLGAAHIDNSGDDRSITFLDEIELNDLGDAGDIKIFQEDIPIANRLWTITVVDVSSRYHSGILFVALGGGIILIASIILSVWVVNNDRKTRRFNAMRSQADSEKAALILENARQATKTERELNDFIAHEVRNPVAAAMAATNFVKVALDKEKPLQENDAIELAREDISIIDNALRFINDLLRNMLDMHRAASKQLQITMAPADLLHDILEPVGGMLYRRGSKVKLIVDCPENLWVMTDTLRLKQVILNLGRNSTKFIDEGFIRLKAEEVNNNVRLFVDDSGSGIPAEKRQRLFAKFQESLDMLSQGTGIGLFLCKNLVELMGGQIYLDDDYFSGIPGHPGTRFVVDLQTSSIQAPMADHVPCQGDDGVDTNGTGTTYGMTLGEDDDLNSIPTELPEKCKILFVDDDSVLRKLFSRSVKNLAPEWEIREAANGETALRLTEEEDFDVIFVDMYMASVEKQLLGTETVAELRNRGVTCRICGLSANDKEEEYYQAGADAFMFKPFPCESYALTQALCRILYQDQKAPLDVMQDF